MKLTVMLCLVFALQVGARVASQTVSFSGRQVSLITVFQAIERQTGYVFFYDVAYLLNAKPVTMQVHQLALPAFLEQLFREQPFSYSISRTAVVVVPREIDPMELQARSVNGRVTDSAGRPLEGASIAITGKTTTASSNAEGYFSVLADSGDQLNISFIGYDTRHVRVPENNDLMMIRLERTVDKLEEMVVSNGYQNLNKERATGSFVNLDNELLNRRVSTNILDRLEDLVPGLYVKGGAKIGNQTNLLVRGQSSIQTSTEPLIVIDNFPYEGNISNINPNDVQSITILKDAAAASIWGARAGNGVIVITTKKGKMNSAPRISVNINTTLGEKPDVYYVPKMSSLDFIDLEKLLFSLNFYQAAENNSNKKIISPVVELLIASRDGKISPAAAEQQINAFKKQDVRSDYDHYFLQKSVNQQYALNVSGGGLHQQYYLSAGLDKNSLSARENSYQRVTVNARNTFQALQDRLEITSGIYYTQSTTTAVNTVPDITQIMSTQRLVPYARLADNAGKPLPVSKDFRVSYLDTAGQGSLLDWQYRPLQELHAADNHIRLTDYRISLGLKYKIWHQLQAEVLYQYNKNTQIQRNRQGVETYYTRNLINQFTQINSDGSLSRPIPVGDIVDQNYNYSTVHNVRTQLVYNRTFNGDHRISALAGWELKNWNTTGNSYRQYGYDPQLGTYQDVPYGNFFTYYYNQGSTDNIIPSVSGVETGLTDRFLSYYANASYTYKNRYVLSASGRIDRSNLFGVTTNQKRVPLYSAGASWVVNQEKFYHVSWMPALRLRFTYGYSGNVDKTLSAYTTANYMSTSYVGLPYLSIQNPPNPSLRWERIGIANWGVDFTLKKNILSGSIEYYRKKGYDLIGKTPFAPQTGITTFTGNSASTNVHGLDVLLTSLNLHRALTWSTTWIVSLVHEKVTRYEYETADITAYVLGTPPPTAGKPLRGVYSYRWAGLNPQTGAPQGYIQDKVSEDYSTIINAASLNDIIYHGPSRPTVFGSVRNTFSWHGLSLSATLRYQLGYYVRKESIFYSDALTGVGGHGDYALRWQKPGDERFTSVPSMPMKQNGSGDIFYNYSSVLVDKGDHVNLQDLQLSYTMGNGSKKRFINSQLYFYANNVGMLWKANKWGMDPDYLTRYSVPPARTYSIGFKTEF